MGHETLQSSPSAANHPARSSEGLLCKYGALNSAAMPDPQDGETQKKDTSKTVRRPSSRTRCKHKRDKAQSLQMLPEEATEYNCHDDVKQTRIGHSQSKDNATGKKVVSTAPLTESNATVPAHTESCERETEPVSVNCIDGSDAANTTSRRKCHSRGKALRKAMTLPAPVTRNVSSPPDAAAPAGRQVRKDCEPHTPSICTSRKSETQEKKYSRKGSDRKRSRRSRTRKRSHPKKTGQCEPLNVPLLVDSVVHEERVRRKLDERSSVGEEVPGASNICFFQSEESTNVPGSSSVDPQSQGSNASNSDDLAYCQNSAALNYTVNGIRNVASLIVSLSEREALQRFKAKRSACQLLSFCVRRISQSTFRDVLQRFSAYQMAQDVALTGDDCFPVGNPWLDNRSLYVEPPVECQGMSRSSNDAISGRLIGDETCGSHNRGVKQLSNGGSTFGTANTQLSTMNGSVVSDNVGTDAGEKEEIDLLAPPPSFGAAADSLGQCSTASSPVVAVSAFCSNNTEFGRQFSAFDPKRFRHLSTPTFLPFKVESQLSALRELASRL